MPIIDAHNHFWRYAPSQYAWIDETMQALRRDFMPEDLQAATAGVGVEGSVAVEARQSTEETRFLLGLSDRHPRILGVVGWVDLADPGVAADLEGFRGHPRFKGVRHVVQAEPDPRFLEGAAFNRGIGLLAPLGLTFDLLIFPEQLPAAIAFVDRHPGQAFVLDHLAKPDIASGEIDREWLRLIRDLSRRPHVACKLSGMVTEVTEKEWTAELLTPYADRVLEAFGPGRLMAGSDWPVCLQRSSYERWWRFLTEWSERLSPGEQAGILGGNAKAFYSL